MNTIELEDLIEVAKDQIQQMVDRSVKEVYIAGLSPQQFEDLLKEEYPDDVWVGDFEIDDYSAAEYYQDFEVKGHEYRARAELRSGSDINFYRT